MAQVTPPVFFSRLRRLQRQSPVAGPSYKQRLATDIPNSRNNGAGSAKPAELPIFRITSSIRITLM